LSVIVKRLDYVEAIQSALEFLQHAKKRVEEEIRAIQEKIIKGATKGTITLEYRNLDMWRLTQLQTTLMQLDTIILQLQQLLSQIPPAKK